MNLSTILLTNLTSRGDLPTVTFLPRGDFLKADTLSGLQLHSKALELACFISEKTNYRTNSEQQVLLAMAPGLTFVATFIAGLYAGVTIAPIPVSSNKLQQQRFNNILANCDSKEIFCDESSYEVLKEALPAHRYRLHLIASVSSDALSSLPAQDKTVELPGFSKMPTDSAYVQYTSGSVQNPKGILISQANALHNIALITQEWNMDRHSKVGSWLPHYHDMGLGAILTALLNQAEFIFMSPLAFVQKPVRWLQIISHFGIQVSGGPAFGYQRCTNDIRDEDLRTLDLSTWKIAFVGSEIVHKEVVTKFNKRFYPCGLASTALFACYGMAEANLFVTGRVESMEEMDPTDKDNSIVQPCLISEQTKASIAIVDFDRNMPVINGSLGEIWIQSDSLAHGYIDVNNRGEVQLNNRPFMARTVGLDGKWFRTGDMGYIKDQYLYVLGRQNDFLKVNGLNVATADIIWLACQVDENLNPQAAVSFRLDLCYDDSATLLIEVFKNVALDIPKIEQKIRAKLMTNFSLDIADILILKRGSLARTSSGKIKQQAIRQQYDKEAYQHKLLKSSPQEELLF